MTSRSDTRDRILAIGDGVQTDVAGANRQALDLLFVAGGIHAAELAGADGAMAADRVEAFLSARGAHSKWAGGDLRW